MKGIRRSLAARGCPRGWEMEAARDGRLRAKDLDSALRHLATCQSCQERQARLEALGAALQALPPVSDDALAARRTRHRLFAEADELVVDAPETVRPRRWLVAGAFVLAAAGGVTLLVGIQRAAPRASSPVAAASAGSTLQIEVQAQGSAVWHKTQLGDQVRLDVAAGEIRASIGKRRQGQTLVIRLPDGEIDDIGTVLSVRVEQGRTTSVRVSEGRVRLRLEGKPSLELGAGENWSIPAVAAPAPATVTSASAEASLKPKAARTAVVSKSTPAVATTSATDAIAAPLAPAATTTPPSDARAEDDAYLHIVSLLRAHQFTEARAAAKDYLRHFPSGFRREEVLGIATSEAR